MKIIIVDNEAIQISNLQKICERIYPNAPIYIATKFDKAYETVQKHNENGIFFCSKDLPGLSGTQLIERIRKDKISKNFKFVLTAHSITQDQKKQALKCGIESFLMKPFQVEDVLPILKNAFDIIDAREQKDKMQKQFLDLKDNFDAEVFKIKEIIDMILDKRIEGIIDKSSQIEDASLWIAKKFGINDPEELNNLKIAAKLQFTGRLILNDKWFKEPVMKDGRLNDPILKEIPNFAAEITSKIKGYEKVAEIIQNLYENVDGTGFPEGKHAAEIPKTSRVLRVCSDFFDMLDEGLKKEEAVDKVITEARRLYDHIPAAYIDQYLASHGMGEGSKNEIPVALSDLRTGCILSRNIMSSEGLVLLGTGTNMNADNLDKLRESAKTEGIIGDIYIFDIAGSDERNAS